MALAAALIVAAALVWSALQIVRELRHLRADVVQSRSLQLVQMFAPAIDAAHNDPRALLVWQPLARIARELFPAEFAMLDRAASRPFPFDPSLVQKAHARWTSDWLAWERAHDTEYKLKAAAFEEELTRAGDRSMARARLEAVEQEKLELYQRRYEEYVRVAKALQTLDVNRTDAQSASPSRP